MIKEVKLYLDKKGDTASLYIKDGKRMLRLCVFSGSHDYVDIWLRTDKEVEKSRKKIRKQEEAWKAESLKEVETRRAWWKPWYM